MKLHAPTEDWFTASLISAHRRDWRALAGAPLTICGKWIAIFSYVMVTVGNLAST